jgi:hypothetical protein
MCTYIHKAGCVPFVVPVLNEQRVEPLEEAVVHAEVQISRIPDSFGKVTLNEENKNDREGLW